MKFTPHKAVPSAILALLLVLSLVILILSSMSMHSVTTDFTASTLAKAPIALTLVISVLALFAIPPLFLTPPLRSSKTHANGVVKAIGIAASVLYGVVVILAFATIIFNFVLHYHDKKTVEHYACSRKDATSVQDLQRRQNPFASGSGIGGSDPFSNPTFGNPPTTGDDPTSGNTGTLGTTSPSGSSSSDFGDNSPSRSSSGISLPEAKKKLKQECAVETGRRWVSFIFLLISLVGVGALVWAFMAEGKRARVVAPTKGFSEVVSYS